MKKIIIPIIILMLIFIGCSNGGNDKLPNAPSDQNSESASHETSGLMEDQNEHPDESEVPFLPDETAINIVITMYDSLFEAAGNNDYDSFRKLYDNDFEDLHVEDDFELFKSLIAEGLKEDLDIGILFTTNDVIGASIYQYTNITSGNLRNHTNTQFNLYMLDTDEGWKLSQSDRIQEACQTAFIPILIEKHGEDCLEKGFLSMNHCLLFNKVLTNDIDVSICKATPKDDGSLDVVLAIMNGLDNDIFNFSFDKLILYSSRDQISFADLSGLSLNSTSIIYSKEIAEFSFNISSEELLVPIDEIDFQYMGVESSADYNNRD